jgi:formylmethanofuran dehydrogenase subunit E
MGKIIVGLPPEVIEAFRKASEEAKERTKELQSEATFTCSRCGKPIPNSNLYESRGRYYCEVCKTPKAKKVYVLSGFSFQDVKRHLP